MKKSFFKIVFSLFVLFLAAGCNDDSYEEIVKPVAVTVGTVPTPTPPPVAVKEINY